MEATSTPAKKRSPFIFVVMAGVLVAAFFGAKLAWHSFTHESTDNAQVETNVVPVVSRVAGFIDSVGVVDYGLVKQGQHIVTIDPREYQLAVLQASADVLNAEADIANARAQLNNAIANKKVATANAEVQKTRLDKAKSDLTRDEGLYTDKAITLKQLEDTRSNYDAAAKQYQSNLEQINYANSQMLTADAQIKKAQASVETRKAALDQAKLRLSYCTITAPAEGQIGKRNLEKGQYVQPGQPLFTIVNDAQFWVIANFKETQIKNVKVGQEVFIKLDGYPDVEITGKVASFSLATGAKFSLLPPDNATGNFVKVTQRVPVKIELTDISNYKNLLRAGLNVEVEVKIE
ncbi:MAG TPA: HlyD family secretion protein [Cyclobacteriaceae bacterium]|jgi:membrane fusion protein (multidrug efflux system)|nr:HlyD family secretion protein [Cyclobacteriaceae bacterium]